MAHGQINHKGFWALMDLTEPRQKISSYNTMIPYSLIEGGK